MAGVGELARFAADLAAVPGTTQKLARAAVQASAAAIEADMRRAMSSSRSFGPVARAITTTTFRGGDAAEVGPRPGSPGSLANIAYFGTSRGGGTVEDPGAALHRERPTFEAALRRAVTLK